MKSIDTKKNFYWNFSSLYSMMILEREETKSTTENIK
jgi:hypothetical protein